MVVPRYIVYVGTKVMYQGTLPMVVPTIVYGVTEVHCLWYRGTLSMVLPRYIAYGGVVVHCLWWYRGTFPIVVPVPP